MSGDHGGQGPVNVLPDLGTSPVKGSVGNDEDISIWHGYETTTYFHYIFSSCGGAWVIEEFILLLKLLPAVRAPCLLLHHNDDALTTQQTIPHLYNHTTQATTKRV
jgi:hypothetical protein